MGFLDWFRKRPAAAADDWVYGTEAEKFRGLAARAGQRLAAGDRVLVLAHFPDTLVRAGAALHEAGLAIDTRGSFDGAEFARWLRDPGPQGEVRAMLARSLPAAAPDTRAPAAVPEAPALTVLMAEMHALPAAWQRIVDWTAALPARVLVHRCIALDEPVLRLLVPAATLSLLRRMGMPEGDRIENPLVTRGLLGAQRKLEQRVTGDGPADSAEEWLRRYCQA